jgi:hypothetical protein
MVVFASQTSTEHPARASVIAAARPFGPDPTTTASHAYDMVMHYQPLWGVREQLFCFPVQRPRIVAAKLRSPAIQGRQAGDPLTSLRLGARFFFSMRF